MFILKEILTASMVLFAVIDIVGSIPYNYKFKRKSRTHSVGKGLNCVSPDNDCFFVYWRTDFVTYWS